MGFLAIPRVAYRDTWPNRFGCDSIVILNLNIKPISTKSIFKTICANQWDTFNGISHNQTGAYLDTFTNSVGCDSIVTLNLTVNRVDSTTLNQNICNGDSIYFNGTYLKIAGFYRDTLANQYSCDSFLFLNLSYNAPTSYAFYDTTCSNVPYLFNGFYRTVSGIYKDTLLNSRGCDSIVDLNLFVKSTSSYSYSASTCSNVPYFFNGLNRTSSGVYFDTLINTNGCDSFITMTLSVKATSMDTSLLRRCAGTFYFYNGFNRITTGLYRDTLTNSVGCDSFDFLDLRFGGPDTTRLYDTICSNYPRFFNGINQNVSGIYRDTFSNIYGCDSLILLHLFVKKSDTTNLVSVICQNQSVSVGSNVYNMTGKYSVRLNNRFNCDSLILLDLTVNKVDTGYIDTNICYNTSYFFNGNSIMTAGIYWDTLTTVKGCDSFIRLRLSKFDSSTFHIHHTICSNRLFSFNNTFPNQTGVYRDTFRSRYGCDSFVVLNLTVVPTSIGVRYDTICWDQSIRFKGKDISAPGVYTDTILNSLGCDSFLTLHLAKRSQKQVSLSYQNGVLISSIGYSFL